MGFQVGSLTKMKVIVVIVVWHFKKKNISQPDMSSKIIIVVPVFSNCHWLLPPWAASRSMPGMISISMITNFTREKYSYLVHNSFRDSLPHFLWFSPSVTQGAVYLMLAVGIHPKACLHLTQMFSINVLHKLQLRKSV